MFAALLMANLSACVSLSSYERVEKERDSLKVRTDTLARLNDRLGILNGKLSDSLSLLGKDFSALKGNYDQLKSNSSQEVKKLIGDLEREQKNVAAREQRLSEVEATLAARDSTLNALQKKLNDALLGFKDSGLTVKMRDGKIYVSLSDKLLFASGSTEIDKKGKDALLKLSEVLNKQADISIVVEGHTDNVPVVRQKDYKDNWDLSVLRSTEVIRYLTNDGKVDSKRVVASGHSEFYPVDAANTAEARAKNRRTDIVLTPKLESLFELVGKKK